MTSVPDPQLLQPPTLAEARRLRAQLDEREVAAAMEVLARLLRAGAEELARASEQRTEGDVDAVDVHGAVPR